jgi:nitrite reductase (NADH) small subunit
MGLLKTLIMGRENGLRAGLRRRFMKSGSGDTSPSTSHSAPGRGASRQDGAPPPAEAALGLRPEAPKDVTPPDGFEVVLHKDSLKPGLITEIIIAGTAIAVANVDGTFLASTNTCPHAGGPLGEGTLAGSVLTCPYHGWAFDLASGACITNPDMQLELYDVEVVGDAVCVRI